MSVINNNENEIMRIIDQWERCDKNCLQWDEVIAKCN